MAANTEMTEFVKYLQDITQVGSIVQTVQLENSTSKPITLLVEPFGDLVSMPPGAKYPIVGQQPKDYGMHVELSDGHIQIWIEGHIAECLRMGLLLRLHPTVGV